MSDISVLDGTNAQQEQKRPIHRWGAGQSGNPQGRPKGSRNKLGEAFLNDLYADWQQNGTEVIQRVRAEKPDAYLKVVASIVPKELIVRDETLDSLSDDDLMEVLGILRQAIKDNKRQKAAVPATIEARVVNKASDTRK